MSPRNHYFKRFTYNRLCDVCGWEFKNDELLDRWDGCRVCPKDWEPEPLSNFPDPPHEGTVPADNINKEVEWDGSTYETVGTIGIGNIILTGFTEGVDAFGAELSNADYATLAFNLDTASNGWSIEFDLETELGAKQEVTGVDIYNSTGISVSGELQIDRYDDIRNFWTPITDVAGQPIDLDLNKAFTLVSAGVWKLRTTWDFIDDIPKVRIRVIGASSLADNFTEIDFLKRG